VTLEIGLSQTTWNLRPATEVEEILQCVKCCLWTAKGTVFNYRDFGIDVTMIDRPINAVQNKFVAECARAIQKFEPRCRLKKISWAKSDALDGQLKPIITIEI